MIVPPGNVRVVLVAGPIDFRAGMNRLASLVANELGRVPMAGTSSCSAHGGAIG